METGSSFNNISPQGTAKDATSAAHGAVDRATASADEAARSLQPVVEHASQFAHRAVDKVADVVSAPSAWLEKGSEKLRATQRDLAAQTHEYVVAHPWRCVVMAFATGVVVGRLAR